MITPRIAERTSSTVDPEKMRILIRRVDHTGPALAVCARVQDAIRKACSPVEIADLIGKNLELASRVVRLANSAGFGNRKAESLRHAVDLLGWQRVFNLAMTVAMREEAENVISIPNWEPEFYQRRSVALAIVSQMLSARIEPTQAERQYMCGLFQDWGFLLLAKFTPDQLRPAAATLASSGNVSPIEVEEFYYGTNHAIIGSIAAWEYDLGADVAAAIRYHHEPALAEPPHQVTADIAHVASWVVGELGLHVFPGSTNHELDKFCLNRLGWTMDAVQGLHQAILAATDSVSISIATT